MKLIEQHGIKFLQFCHIDEREHDFSDWFEGWKPKEPPTCFNVFRCKYCGWEFAISNDVGAYTQWTREGFDFDTIEGAIFHADRCTKPVTVMPRPA